MPDPDTTHAIFRFHDARWRLVEEVVARSCAAYGHSPERIRLALNEAALAETARPARNPEENTSLRRWRDLHRSLARLEHPALERLLKNLVEEAAHDIVGDFDPKVHRFSVQLAPYLLSFILRGKGAPLASALDDRIQVTGATEVTRALARRGTLILVPTHSSNLDSLVVGYALHLLGLPPFMYGAGKNLFTNWFLSFFMRHLGAYRVDRRLTHHLYKDVLKTYSQVSLEHGYHGLFFPGGGRSRSNAVEQHLKLGLLGTGLSAYLNNLEAGKERPDIFVVPATINTHLVLEAKSLIGDHLQQLGRTRYFTTRSDESRQAGQMFRFIRQLARMDSQVIIRLGEPLDLFGNRVDAEGRSLDPHGRPVDRRSYVLVDGQPAASPQRDQEYTRELGVAVADAFLRHTVILSTHLVACALERLHRARDPRLDLFQRLRLQEGTTLEVPDVLAEVAALKQRLVELARRGELVLGPDVEQLTEEKLLDHALGHFKAFHRTPVAIRQGHEVHLTDLELLHYYANRLAGRDLDRRDTSGG
jgi:glycerol-3-phosphate O-acyltransferase